MRHLYAIAVGSNRPHGRCGRPPQVVETAIARLERTSVCSTPPPFAQSANGGAGRDFANAVALVESELEPPQMLARLKAIEREFGRRPGKRWGPRVLDLDIALWSGGGSARPGLIIPHPRLASEASFFSHWRPSRRIGAVGRHLPSAIWPRGLPDARHEASRPLEVGP